MSSPESGITRREFFKKTGDIAIKAIALGAITSTGVVIRNEIEKGQAGIIKTDEGNFIPLYEIHSVGISTERFPKDMDALFREQTSELNLIENFFIKNPELLTGPEIDLYKPRTNMREVVSNLAANNAPLVFGDIRSETSDGKIKNILSIAEETMGVTALIILAGLALNRLLSNKAESVTRRKILTLPLKALALYGFSNYTSHITSRTGKIENPEWVKRLGRIHGITSHMHPEQYVIFFRNAIIADKLLLTGKHLKEKLGRKPNIGFWVGVGHSGIEDFLQLGQDTCRKAINLYPESFLKYFIRESGGAEDFSSVLLAYPRVLPDGKFSYELDKITDKELMESLPV